MVTVLKAIKVYTHQTPGQKKYTFKTEGLNVSFSKLRWPMTVKFHIMNRTYSKQVPPLYSQAPPDAK